MSEEKRVTNKLMIWREQETKPEYFLMLKNNEEFDNEIDLVYVNKAGETCGKILSISHKGLYRYNTHYKEIMGIRMEEDGSGRIKIWGEDIEKTLKDGCNND